MRDDWNYRRGDIYLADLNPCYGFEQGGIRPVLVLQNNVGNFFCPTLIVAPLTSQIKKLNQPTHFVLDNVRGLDKPAMVIAEQIRTIDKRRIRKYLGNVDRQTMNDITACIDISLGLYEPENKYAVNGQEGGIHGEIRSSNLGKK